METKGLEYLRKKLKSHYVRNYARRELYDMKYQYPLTGVTIPPHVRAQFNSVMGWCAKAVDVLADRLAFKKFSNDIFEINEIFEMNNPDIFFDSAILSALKSSCCFVHIQEGENDIPRLSIISPLDATGIIDQFTGMLKEGYAVLSYGEDGHPLVEAYFLPYETRYITWINGKESIQYFRHNAPYPLLVPVMYRPDEDRPFGRSRISRSAISWQKQAKDTLERMQVTAEFYAFPQKYVVGLSPDAEPLDSWKATISSMLSFDKDEDGDKPTLGQFTQYSVQPFVEQIRMLASGFAGETGLTLDDLGFSTDNPSSAESIKASHESLRLLARKAQRNFGSCFLNVGYLAVCLRDDFSYSRSQFYKTKPKWYPLFEPDSSMLSAIGDGAIKLNQALPEYLNKENLSDLTGIDND